LQCFHCWYYSLTWGNPLHHFKIFKAHFPPGLTV
jgi:hypothetical protein